MLKAMLVAASYGPFDFPSASAGNRQIYEASIVKTIDISVSNFEEEFVWLERGCCYANGPVVDGAVR